jgi:hypothetical protein
LLLFQIRPWSWLSLLRTALLVVLLLVTSVIGPGQAIGQILKPDEKTERELRALRQEFLDAMNRGIALSWSEPGPGCRFPTT